METVVLFVVGVLVMVVGLALSIGLHELGHFLPAKRFGVRVSQFMIGFGPTVFSRRRGETEYGVKAIPLGGYIAMTGMFPPEKPGEAPTASSTGFFQVLVQDAPRTDDVASTSAAALERGAVTGDVATREDDDSRSFYRLPVHKRIIIMLGGPVMNLLIGIVLYAIVLCGFGVAQQSTTIGSVSACVIPSSASNQECSADDAPAPGAEAGLLPGDRFVSINGDPVTSWENATSTIRSSAGTPIGIVVERDGKKVALSATPQLTERFVVGDSGAVETDGAGNKLTEEVGFLGIGAATEVVPQPLSAVGPVVGENITRVVELIVSLPQRLVAVADAAFGGGDRDPNGPISVVGVGRVAGEIASINTIPLLDRLSALIGILASLNIALFVFNLIPLLPLDGGHIAGAAFEAVRRFFARVFRRPDPGPVNIAKLLPLTLVVVLVLGGMSALLIYADIVNPISVL